MARLDWIPVRGDSMWPSLRCGDRAGIAAAAGGVYPGDVVVFRSGRGHVIHRVVSISEGRVTLRGDNCAADDVPVHPATIVGRVLRIRRGRLLMERKEWDWGPWLLGRVRLSVKRRAALWLGGAR